MSVKILFFYFGDVTNSKTMSSTYDEILLSVFTANDALTAQNKKLENEIKDRDEKERILRVRLHDMETKNRELTLRATRLMEEDVQEDEDPIVDARNFLDNCDAKISHKRKCPDSSSLDNSPDKPERKLPSLSKSMLSEVLRLQNILQKQRGFEALRPAPMPKEEENKTPAFFYYVCNQSHECTKVKCTVTNNPKDFLLFDGNMVKSLEETKNKGEPFFTYRVNDQHYALNLETMLQLNLKTKRERQIFHVQEIREKKFTPFRLQLPPEMDALEFPILSRGTLTRDMIDWTQLARMVSIPCQCFKPEVHQKENKKYVLHQMWKVNNPELVCRFLAGQVPKVVSKMVSSTVSSTVTTTVTSTVPTMVENQLPQISFGFHGSGSVSPVTLVEEGIDPLLNRNELSDKYLGNCAYLTTDVYAMLTNYGYRHAGPLTALDSHPLLIPQFEKDPALTDLKSRRVTFLGVQFLEGTPFVTQVNDTSKRLKRPPKGYDSVVTCEPFEGLTYYGVFNANQCNVYCVYQFIEKTTVVEEDEEEEEEEVE